MSTWESPSGGIITNVEFVDVSLLAQMYASEKGCDVKFSTWYSHADNKTRRAWQLGYRKEVPE